MKKSILSMNMTDVLCAIINSISSIWPLSLLNKYAKKYLITVVAVSKTNKIYFENPC